MPSDPSRADHRFVSYLLDNFFKKKRPRHDPEEFDRVVRAFARAGGSWERLFRGSAKDIVLLRRLLKLAIKHGYISREPKFR
jgi:hypothetical protein